MYDIAGEFHYREMEARRKLAWKERRLPYALSMYSLRFLYGYGERPERVIGWAAAIIFGLALVHWLFGTSPVASWTPSTTAPCRSRRSATVVGGGAARAGRAASWASARRSSACS